MDDIKILMQKEIILMREVLANMHQEEESLKRNDHSLWANVISQRCEILALLSPIREERILASKLIEYSDDCDILSLRDQIMALIERINMQNHMNEQLYKVAFRPQSALQPEPLKKKKSSIATYPENG